MNNNINILFLAIYNDDMISSFEEIGICSIASFLRQYGYNVKLMRCHEKEVDYDEIKKFKPDILGFPVYDISKEPVYRVCMEIKQEIESVLICVGGCLPSYYGCEMLAEASFLNFAIMGEGELPWLKLVRCIEKGESFKYVNNLIYREGDKIVINKEEELIENLDSLPVPARDMLINSKIKTAIISTSRGCTGKCSFCASQLFWKKWRGRSVNGIVDEIETIVNDYGVSTFNFIDGSFEDPGINCKRVQDLAQEILNRNLEISYFANFRAEFSRKASPDVMRLLKKSGLCGACIGIEAGNDVDLKVYNKIATVEDNSKIIELFRNHDINVEPGFINFNPYTTLKGLHENIDFLEKYQFASNPEFLTNRYRMYKGTTLYDKVRKDGITANGEFDENGYLFADMRIEPLFDFVSNYLIPINKELSKAYYKIGYYSSKYITLLKYLKRKFSSLGENKATQLVKDYEELDINRCLELNSKISCWFRELLLLTEAGWDKEKAESISYKLLNGNYIMEIADELDAIKSSLYLKIMRLNPEYSFYLVKIH